MNELFTLTLNKRSKLNNRYQSNPAIYTQEIMLNRAKKYITLFTEAKEIYITRINYNLDNPETTPKA